MTPLIFNFQSGEPFATPLILTFKTDLTVVEKAFEPPPDLTYFNSVATVALSTATILLNRKKKKNELIQLGLSIQYRCLW